MRPGSRSAEDWTALGLRLFLGGFYVVAGAVKIPDPGRFAEAVSNYRLAPHELVNLIAITLPWVEVVAGLFLIFGIWLRASVGLINVMTSVFIVAITLAVVRGLDIECGCFGTVGGRRAGLVAIAEDVALLAFGLWIAWQHGRQGRRALVHEIEPAAAQPTEGRGRGLTA